MFLTLIIPVRTSLSSPKKKKNHLLTIFIEPQLSTLQTWSVLIPITLICHLPQQYIANGQGIANVVNGNPLSLTLQFDSTPR